MSNAQYVSAIQMVALFRFIVLMILCCMAWNSACASSTCNPALVGQRDALAIAYRAADTVNESLIVSNFEGADEMRLGNTLGELIAAPFKPYLNRQPWYIPGFNYPARPVVFIEVKGQTLKPLRLEVPVFYCADETTQSGYRLVHVPDQRVSKTIIDFEFDDWQQQWTTYQDAYGDGNIFYPMSHANAGGADGGGYVWTDASRWIIDPPEQPSSILAALVYWRWLFPPEWRARTGLGEKIDLRDAVLSVDLRGRNLQLGSSHVTFWITCNGSRWHLYSKFLTVTDQWTRNTLQLPNDSSAWHRSWARGGDAPGFCLDKVDSFGIAFSGVTEASKPSGVLDMDSFSLARFGTSRSQVATPLQ